MLAAELLVKKAVTALSRRHLRSSGYGFLCIMSAPMIGLVTKMTMSMHTTRSTMSAPYSAKISRPFVETVL